MMVVWFFSRPVGGGTDVGAECTQLTTPTVDEGGREGGTGVRGGREVRGRVNLLTPKKITNENTMQEQNK